MLTEQAVNPPAWMLGQPRVSVSPPREPFSSFLFLTLLQYILLYYIPSLPSCLPPLRSTWFLNDTDDTTHRPPTIPIARHADNPARRAGIPPGLHRRITHTVRSDFHSSAPTDRISCDHVAQLLFDNRLRQNCGEEGSFEFLILSFELKGKEEGSCEF